jgi:hypothetical protein
MTELTTFRALTGEISKQKVAATVKKIEDSFARRDVFEGANATVSTSSYAVNRKMVLDNKEAVARFLAALNIEPANLIERKINASKMFNAKALKKVVELARFAVTGNRKIEKVMSAFIICSLAYEAKHNGAAISNAINKSFLSNLDFSKVLDAELADYLADYQHAFISGGKDTQSSQARCVLEALGLGEIVATDNRYRGGLKLNANHAFFADFSAAFVK